MTAPFTGAAGSIEKQDQALDSCRVAVAQGLPPIERHGIVPDDKIAIFEVAPVHRLVGVWQGPGTILQLSRRPRP
jgi:hypothetical protein